MKIKKNLTIFTYDYPLGASELTFIKYELSKIIEHFDKITVVPQKFFKNNRKVSDESSISIDTSLSKKLNSLNIILKFLTYTIFSKIFWEEVLNNKIDKNIFLKIKMAIIEYSTSIIIYNWILDKKIIEDNILYSFWSNQVLISFKKLKDLNKNSILISRTLGSDLNGYIKNDPYVPFLKIKFKNLNKIFVLSSYQQKKILQSKLTTKNKVCINPLGIYTQDIKNFEFNEKKKVLNFLSCGSLIEIKNNLLMIDFLKHYSTFTSKKINYYLIGDGKLKNVIKKRLKNLPNNINCEMIDKVDNLITFMKEKDIDLFMNFSSQEGMSFSVMESLSCAIPVIATNIDANLELVNKNRGYLIDLDDINTSFDKISKEIESDMKTFKFKEKKLDANKFINNNFSNTNLFKKFLSELNKINNHEMQNL